jgi:hypothetical protein
MSWVISGSRRAVLRTFRAQERPEITQVTPGAHQELPGRPQESPRGSQRPSSSPLTALLRLSWGSQEQDPCCGNLSFTEAKPRSAKIDDFEYKISCDVKCQKTIEFLFKNVHHSHTRAPKCIGQSHFAASKTSETTRNQRRYLRKP